MCCEWVLIVLGAVAIGFVYLRSKADIRIQIDWYKDGRYLTWSGLRHYGRNHVGIIYEDGAVRVTRLNSRPEGIQIRPRLSENMKPVNSVIRMEALAFRLRQYLPPTWFYTERTTTLGPDVMFQLPPSSDCMALEEKACTFSYLGP